jgi:hypothetical protein
VATSRGPALDPQAARESSVAEERLDVLPPRVDKRLKIRTLDAALGGLEAVGFRSSGGCREVLCIELSLRGIWAVDPFQCFAD